jgi:hypothetical protein
LQGRKSLSAIYGWSSSLVHSRDFEPSNVLGCPWMVKIWIVSNFAEAFLKHKSFKILKNVNLLISAHGVSFVALHR